MLPCILALLKATGSGDFASFNACQVQECLQRPKAAETSFAQLGPDAATITVEAGEFAGAMLVKMKGDNKNQKGSGRFNKAQRQVTLTRNGLDAAKQPRVPVEAL